MIPPLFSLKLKLTPELFFTLVLCFVSSHLLAGSETQDSLAFSKEWLRIGHYQKDLWGRYRSQVQGDDFFLAPQGNRDPLAELNATLEALKLLKKVGKLQQPVQCAFPERFHFLKDRLKLNAPDVACPELKAYLDRFQAESVSLVFSSAYPHNPGSMFGHTFLKINHQRDADPKRPFEKQDLLDWGISYAARANGEDNGFLFVWSGLTGGYRGEFSLLPYYTKVNEYINSESRDLWEYELNLNREQTLRLLRAIWEVQNLGFFNYYFLHENCAYQPLSFLEIANPEWDLLDFPIYVIPGETIKKIAQIPGAIKQIRYRPALQKQILVGYDNLLPQDQQIFDSLLEGSLKPGEVERAKVLDLVAQYLLFLKKKEGNELEPQQKHLFRNVLLKRSRLGLQPVQDNPLEVSTEKARLSRPDLAHDTYRLGLAAGTLSEKKQGWKLQTFQDLHFKFAYHDLLNNDTGYTPFSQIDFPGLNLRYQPAQGHVSVENVHLLSITSLSPWSHLDQQPSWAFHLEWLTPKDLECDSCRAFHLDIGAGITFGMLQQRGVWYTLLLGGVELGNSFRVGYRWIPTLQSGVILNPISAYKIQFQASWVWDLFQTDRESHFVDLQWNHSFSMGPQWDLRLLTQAHLNHALAVSFYEGRLSLNTYF